LVRILRDQGHRLQEAADGREGLAAVHAEPPDLVITDVLNRRGPALETDFAIDDILVRLRFGNLTVNRVGNVALNFNFIESTEP
jgi:hypothetical protein